MAKRNKEGLGPLRGSYGFRGLGWLAGAMSLSLAERERRAKERAAGQSQRKSTKAAPKEESGSLFDKYAGLAAGPTSTDEEEVAELMEMLGQSPGSQRVSARELTGAQEYFLEANWDPSPHRNPPPSLKSIKPQTREPWAIDAAIYNTKFNASDYGQPTRYGLNVNPPLSQYRLDEPEKRVSAKPGKNKKAPAWNSQPFRSVPYSLRGIKPAPGSTEPWVRDHEKRSKTSVEDTDLIRDATVNELDNGGGEQMFSKKFGYDTKPAWDSSTVTPWRADGRHGRVRGIN